MSKRFGVITNWCVYENIDGVKKWLNFDEVVDLLNDLSEENELLKIRFNEEREKALKFCRNIDTLTIENEQLKSEINMLKTTIGRNEGYIDRLIHKGEWR